VRRRADIPAGFWLVFRRELGWLRHRPFLLCLTTIVPVALMALLMAIFSAGLATKLATGVLDLDGSDLSRMLVRALDATPDAHVVVKVGDLAEGRALILDGAIHALVMLPEHLERDALAGRRPEVVAFYNTQTLTTGNLVLRGISAAVTSVEAGIRLGLRTAEGQPVEIAQAALQPIPVQVHPLFNPTLNYTHFLLAALLPALLQVVVVTGTAYSAGLDIETRHRLRILRRVGNGLWPALAGKLLPYTIIYLAVLAASDAVMFWLFELPLRGSGWVLLLAGALFILACQFLGLLLALLIRPVASAVSIATLLTAPAFGYMGIGFPRLGMSGFASAWSDLLPGTWYLMARIDQTIRGTPLDLAGQPVIVLLAFVVALAGLCAWRLAALRRGHDHAKRERAGVRHAAGGAAR